MFAPGIRLAISGGSLLPLGAARMLRAVVLVEPSPQAVADKGPACFTCLATQGGQCQVTQLRVRLERLVAAPVIALDADSRVGGHVSVSSVPVIATSKPAPPGSSASHASA